MKGQVTIAECMNATRQANPPMVIYDVKKLNQAWMANKEPGMKYCWSDNGWININVLEVWLVEHFLEHAVPA